MERFKFSRTTDGPLTADADTKKGLGAFHQKNPGVLPSGVVDAAAADLVKRTNELMFSTGKSYLDCSRHLQRSDPWLQVASAVKAPDDTQCERQLGIFVQEASGA